MFNYPKKENKFLSIKDWREDERPRERLKKNGAHTLSDSELLAILISYGSKGISAIDLGKSLLDKFQNISNLASRDLSEITAIKGIGMAKAITLSAAFELGKRADVRKSFDDKPMYTHPEQFAKYFIPQFRDLQKEVFVSVLLNSSNQIIREVKVSEGILDACLAHPREIFRIAIAENAQTIVLIHNHPSGNPEPSREDVELTKQLVKAGEIIGIKIVDHIILTYETYYSFAQRRRI